MKNIFLTFLCGVYFFSATGLTELLKVNVLCAHFAETKCQDNSINFLDFLVMHYLTDDNNKDDNASDKELPFKSDTSFFYSYLQAAKINSIKPESPVFVNIQENNFHDLDSFLISKYFAKIWLPPELC